MRSIQSVVAVFMAAAMGLFSVGCGSGTTSTLVTLLNAVADASSVATVVAEGLVASGKISQADASAVGTYATAVSTTVNRSIAELGTTDTNPVKIATISGYFVAVVAPAFPNGSALAPVIQAVISTVTQFISQLNGSTVTTAAKLAPRAPITLTSADKSLLKKTRATTAETIITASKMILPVKL